MTDLPEDLNRWPSDPFEVLNLDRTADARTARRAYFKLVRKYQPDRFPAEFQRVREAYESVENWLKWREADVAKDEDGMSTIANDADDASLSHETDSTDVPNESELQPFELNMGEIDSPTPFQVDPFDQFIEVLEADDLAVAVQHVNRVDPSVGPSQIAKAKLAKYYLSRFLPENSMPKPPVAGDFAVSGVDQKRISWLLKSMESPELLSGAMAQVKIEFDRNYRLATCKSVTNYLGRITECVKLADLYRLRWEAIGHYKVQVVVDDLRKLQPRSLEFGNHRSVWLNLLAESMNYTVWHQDDAHCVKHNRECWQEISESEQSWTADSVELLILAAEEWKQIRGLFKWSAAIPWARSTMPESSQRIWMPVAKEIAADPRASLKMLNFRFQNSSIAMAVFEEGLRQLALLSSDSDARFAETWEETRDLVACYFHDIRRTDYVSNRIAMMEFCILNQLSPMSFARAADSFLAPENTISWSDLVQNDGPLLCVVNACHAVNW